MSLSLAELVELLPQVIPAAPAIPTGISALDAVLNGGGLPRGRLTELVGPKGSGKTTFARAVVVETIAGHGWVAWIDAQRTLDPRDWVGLDDDQGVWVVRPHDATRAAWCADVLLRSGAFALVILDGAPVLNKPAAVRLTRLARESNAAFMVMSDSGSSTQLSSAVRLVMERPGSRKRETEEVNATHTIGVRVDKGGLMKTVEVHCAIHVARRLCAHPEVPDRRGVARGPAGGLRHGRRERAASPPAPDPGRGAPIVIEPGPRSRDTGPLG